jgi:methenyltetrahydromethanopterin cyclohydrolase
MMAMSTLNERAWQLADAMAADANLLSIAVRTLDCGTRLIDCGVHVAGSIEAGLRLAQIGMAGLGTAHVELDESIAARVPTILATVSAPVAACMASQYAGWEVKSDGYFAMGSGPMRAAAGREPLFDAIGHREQAERCVGVLETAKLPTETVCREQAEKCRVSPEQLTLLAARTSSLAGTVQIVARSVETALHKLHELGFDLSRIEYGFGSAPLPPRANDDFVSLGRTNDAILYGGRAVLLVRGDDASLEQIGPRVPSSASPDFGRPFAEIFARYDHDFYRIDPMLFSPAVVELYNVESGNAFRFGRMAPEVLAESIGTGSLRAD